MVNKYRTVDLNYVHDATNLNYIQVGTPLKFTLDILMLTQFGVGGKKMAG